MSDIPSDFDLTIVPLLEQEARARFPAGPPAALTEWRRRYQSRWVTHHDAGDLFLGSAADGPGLRYCFLRVDHQILQVHQAVTRN